MDLKQSFTTVDQVMEAMNSGRYIADRPPILLIDEIDRADEEFEALGPAGGNPSEKNAETLLPGWDLGSKDMLRSEMAAIREKARRVIWLNPLAGDPDVQSLCGGMRAALPYIHHVLPADSLRSLMRAGHVLAGVLREH